MRRSTAASDQVRWLWQPPRFATTGTACLVMMNPVMTVRMASTQDFNGKWALVTGASAGLAWRWHGNWLRMAQSCSHGAPQRPARGAGRGTRLQGIEVRIVAADLNDPAAPQQIYDATEGAGLAVDILINNAGLGQLASSIAVPKTRN